MPAYADKQILSAIEIGSKGVKGTAYEISGKDIEEHYATKKIYDRKINPNLMSGISSDGYLKEERIKDAANAVKAIFTELKALDPQFIVIVSSTAFEKIQNSTVLKNAIRDATGQELQAITSDDEIYYGLLACIPQKRIANSILLDIGSGNTKVGYLTPFSSNRFESAVFKYGTVTLKEAATAAGGDYREQLSTLYRNEISPILKKVIQDKPGLSSPNRRVYIVGGASWATANFARPQDIEKPYVNLKLAEIKNINHQFIVGKFNLQPQKAEAQTELAKIRDVFTTEDLQSGSTLLYSILADIDAGQRKIIFPREGGWIIGYMFAKYNESIK